MPKFPDLTEAKRIAALMLAMPPKPHDQMKVGKKPTARGDESPAKRTTGKGRVRLAKGSTAS